MKDSCHTPIRLARLAVLALALAAPPLWAETDVRLLIDVSGSMRQNDPHNLRVPALRLVDELLPAGTRAGVWLFAEKTEVLAPPGEVDADWKRRTRARLDRIHSRGLMTDIEGAIDTALRGWEGPAGDDERHLVLLTDGLVDVSKDDSEDAASRERIAGEQLERLKELGAQVHTIALSDKVDMPLMQLLSKETGGWLETAQSADALQRIFLHMLEQTAAPTTVPLKGNRFDVDDQVSELTLLAFRPEGGKTELVPPSGGRISASQLPKDATWRSEAGYDLVTLTKPEAGQWQLLGVEDPDNRVVVVTDLDIAAAPIPTALGAGDRPKLETWLTDHRHPVTRKDLLGVLAASAEVSPVADGQPQTGTQTPSSGAEPAATADTEHPSETTPASPAPGGKMALDRKSGRFVSELDTSGLAPGVYELRFLIDGGTFKRQTIRRFKVAGPPITIEYDRHLPTAEDPNARMLLTLRAEPDLVDPESVVGYLLVHDPAGKDSVIEIPDSVRLPLGIKVPVQRPGDYLVKGQLVARSMGGETIQVRPEPHTLSFDIPTPKASKDEEDSPEPEAGIHWLALSGYLLAGNLVLAAALGLTWWLLRRPKPAGAPGKSASKAKKQPKGKRK